MRYSIITVSFNSSKTIRRTIESVLNQSYTDYEYIIIDGNSSDGTFEIIEQYESKFCGKLKWVSEPDTGIYNAMNKGIAMAKGEIIGIVNSDDWLELTALDLLNKYIIDNDRIYTGYMNFIYRNGNVQILKTDLTRFKRYISMYRMGLNHPATFVPANIYEKVGVFDENLKLYADADFINRCYLANVGICIIPEILCNMLDKGASNKISFQMFRDRKYILNKYSKNWFEATYLLFLDYLFGLAKLIIPTKMLYDHRKRNNQGLNIVN